MIHFNSGKDKKSTKKEEDNRFHSKSIKHDPQAESARAKFGLNDDQVEEEDPI